MTMSKVLTDDLVQPIVVDNKSFGSLEEMVSRVAVTSLLSLLDQDDGVIDEWFVSGQRKTVRRVKSSSKLDRAEVLDSSLRVGGVCVACLQWYDGFDSVLKSAQVSGWGEYENTFAEWHANPTFGTVLINESVEMSPGKLAAQVAHVLVSQYMDTGIVACRDETVAIEFVPQDQVKQCRWVIRDNGHTEVEPGTVTVGLTL